MVPKSSPKVCCATKPPSKAVYHSFRPIFYMSRLFGLAPFSVQTNLFDEVQRVKLTFFDLLWFCTAILMYLSLAVFGVLGPIRPSDFGSVYILVLGDQLLLVFGLVMCFVSVIMDMVNRNRIMGNIQRFEAFDKEVEIREESSFMADSNLPRNCLLFFNFSFFYCFYFLIFFWNFHELFELSWNLLNFLELSWNFLNFLSFLWNFFNFLEFSWNFLNFLKFLPFQMRSYGITVDYNRFRVRLILWSVISTIVFILLTVYSSFSHETFRLNVATWKLLILFLSYNMQQGVLSAIATNYGYLIMNLSCRFDKLNKSME